MFKDISGQECSLTAGQIQEASGRFVKDYVSQLAFHLLCELFILLGKLDRIFWVIFKLNLLFVLFKIFAWAKCVSKTLISLLLPAFSGAVKRLSVVNGLANGEHIPLSTFAIMSNFCLAFDIRTAAARVAGSLASVLTSFELLHASLSTTFFHLFLTQFIICWIFEALALGWQTFWQMWPHLRGNPHYYPQFGLLAWQYIFSWVSLPQLQTFETGSKHGGQEPRWHLKEHLCPHCSSFLQGPPHVG